MSGKLARGGAVVLSLWAFSAAWAQTDALPAWSEDKAKQAKGWTIVDMKADWKTVFPGKP